jgi:hypothetical protein
MAPLLPASRREPIHDLHPLTGISIEVFWVDRTLETFGRGNAGWFWWPRRRGLSSEGPATGPFATSYAAYRHAMSTARSTVDDVRTLGERTIAFMCQTCDMDLLI